MQMVHNENYITIQGWMINELGLKGNSLIYMLLFMDFLKLIIVNLQAVLVI